MKPNSTRFCGPAHVCGLLLCLSVLGRPLPATAQDPQPKAPASQPTAPASQPNAPASQPTAPASQPTSMAPLPPGAPPGLGLIQRQDLIRMATWLAADERGGRLTGSPGQKEAAAYIAAHLAQLGLEPLGDMEKGKRQFLQRYPLERMSLEAKKTTLSIGGRTFKDGYLVYPSKDFQEPVSAAGKLILAGRIGGTGGAVEVRAAKGTLPVVFVRRLKGRSVDNQFMASFSVMGRLLQKTRKLEDAGASAVIVCPLDDAGPLCNTLSYIGLMPGKDLLKFGNDAGLAGQMARPPIPWFVVNRKITDLILQAMGLTRNDVEGEWTDDIETKAAKSKLKGSVKLRIRTDAKAYATNVVAVLRGSDPSLRNEAVVFSAHMDHIGPSLSGDVFNGADDNASGSAGMLAIATAFAKSGKPPRRSLIFLSVSGEELGLWGSQYFSEHPTWPVERIVANINTDMIGRSGPEAGENEISVTPSHTHAKFSTIVQESARIAKVLGLGLTSGDKYYERSDHVNFARKGIPVVFFCDGENEDYHQVSDHADKLDPARMEQIARLAFWTGWSVANADAAPRTVGRQTSWLPE